MKGEHWPAKQVICGRVVALPLYILILCAGEESAPDGAEHAAAPGVVHIDIRPPWRDEEAAFGDHSRKTRISLSFQDASPVNCMGFSQFFSVFVVDCLLETTSGQGDASCSRVAAPRRRLVRRVLFPHARGAQPPEHEDLLGNS